MRIVNVFACLGLLVIFSTSARADALLKVIPEEFAVEHPFGQSADYQMAINLPNDTPTQTREVLLTRVWRDLLERKRHLAVQKILPDDLPRVAAILLDYQTFLARLYGHRPVGMSPDLLQREHADISKLLSVVRRQLQSAPATRSIADYDLLVTLRLPSADSASILASLDRHARVFGPVFRQVPAWRAAIAVEKDSKLKERVLREYLSATEMMHEPRAVLDAQLLLAQHLSTQTRHEEAATLIPPYSPCGDRLTC